MGDLSDVAKLLIGKVEEYGQLLGSKAFPVFVQRQILWGHINQYVAWVAVGLFVLSVIFMIIGGLDDSYDHASAFFYAGFPMFFISMIIGISCFIKSALLLASPEYEALMQILYIMTGGSR